MRTKPDGYSPRDDLKSPANRVAVLLGFFYFLDHLLSHIRKYALERRRHRVSLPAAAMKL
jgi:hypothetical protein